MGDRMDVDSDAVDLPTAAGTPRQANTEGKREQLADPIHSSRAVPTKAGKRLYYTKKTNAKLLRLLNNLPRLVRDEAITFFDANMENFLGDWITILEHTNLPSNTASSDPYVITVFRRLDGTIDAGESIRSRLAHIQLMRVFQSLERIIATERRARQIQRERGKGNATVAMNIYKSAQQPSVSRHDPKKRKQIARWWTTFAGPSPLLVIIYSEVAEKIVKNCRKRDKQTLEFLASTALQNAPGELVKACIGLAGIAELAIRPDQTLDRQRAVAEARHDLRRGAK
ncbi:hypothetical protein QBC46DRAFT_429375 [Diplogelasinospora grovesii]|uniref:Uncharacterized protein n=1 Tax=Diplogelasinospora grovesii TaxID=303347 RepID=A0AAN6RZC8_9PEZI|nr:hypothetical protein QBC46DRAFT_429375 [Diplogelasinospora grovesii]